MPSSKNATATPMVKPKAASAAIHPSIRPIRRPWTAGAGQTGNKPTVSASDSAMRLTLGPAARPGIGTIAIRPDTRASTSRKPHSIERSSVRLACIPAEIAEQCRW